MKRIIFRILAAGVLIVSLTMLVWNATKSMPVSVDLAKVEYGPVESIVANTRVGTVKACRRAFLAPASGGQVAKLTVREGSQVKTDQILMEVWNQDLKAEIDLEIAESESMRARAQQACALAKGADREAKRQINLQKHQQIVSKVQVDTAVTNAEAQRFACNAAIEAIKVSESRTKVAQTRLKRTIVKSPFDGTVAEVNVELGEYVTPSPPGIATLPAIDLLDLSCLYVSAPIDEVDAPFIKTGMKVCVSLDAFPNRLCSGTVTRIAPYVLEKEKQARTVEVEVRITDPQDLIGLIPGYSADIEISLVSKQRVLRVPTEAVLDGDKVLLVDQEDHLSEHRFKPGIANWKFTEVQSGLSEGETIVLSVGREGVEDGAEITEDKAS